jgi:hypothetical protein
MEQIRQLPQEPDRQAKLAELLSLGQAPSGGYYDDLGNPLAQPHLVRSPDYTLDPASLRSPYVGFQPEPGLRRSWCTYADGLFDVPVLLKYEGLDPSKQYKVRIVYASESRQRPVRLTTDDGLEIHPLMDRPMPPRPIERSIPPEATRDGTLVLEFRSDPERGGNGRGPQVADVWLMPIE